MNGDACAAIEKLACDLEANAAPGTRDDDIAVFEKLWMAPPAWYDIVTGSVSGNMQPINKAVPSVDRIFLSKIFALRENPCFMQQRRDEWRERLAMRRNQANKMIGLGLDNRDHPDFGRKTE